LRIYSQLSPALVSRNQPESAGISEAPTINPNWLRDAFLPSSEDNYRHYPTGEAALFHPDGTAECTCESPRNWPLAGLLPKNPESPEVRKLFDATFLHTDRGWVVAQPIVAGDPCDFNHANSPESVPDDANDTDLPDVILYPDLPEDPPSED